MVATLPPKYYLQHAQELFDFVQHKCAHLLQPEHQQYLQGFAELPTDAQCMLVRLLSRKPRHLPRSSLHYEEIAAPDHALAALASANYASSVQPADWGEFVAVLTKPQLLGCLEMAPVKVRSNTPKPELVALSKEYFNGDEACLSSLRQAYVVRRQQAVADYILFLYFGDLRNRLQKFAMRDLGVLKTRRAKGEQSARFANLAEAASAFNLQGLRKAFQQGPSQQVATVAPLLKNTQPIGEGAARVYDKLVLAVGEELSAKQPLQAIAIWRLSNHSKALEKWVRTAHKHGCPKQLQKQLIELRQQRLCPASKLFIEDFYCRKYQGKRTTIYTDMLREAQRQVGIDECYLGNVEEGVLQRYRQAGQQAWFTENKLWHVLFAFTLWPVLYGRQQLQHTEFDRLPAALRSADFYHANQAAIEARISLLKQPATALAEFTKIAATEYGTPNGIFRWVPDLLDILQPCLRYAPTEALATIVRAMAKNYQHSGSGYPDLMVLEDQTLRFEEVKAPGDVLRPNQIISIELLRSAGLQVDITQVQWATDPKQTYAVVDIETTGGQRGGNAITEIAVVKIRNQKIVSEWSTLVNPQRAIPTHITRLTGINNQMVATAPVFAQVADELEAQLADSIFVAHNVGFDYGFIKAAYQSINRSFRKPKFCTVQHARRTFPGLKSYSLGNLARHFDIDLKNAHRALADATATAHLLSLIQEARQQPPVASG